MTVQDNTATAAPARSDAPVLFAREPVVRQRTSPVIVVGLPRSGSSFLAYVLSRLRDWWVFDDLYFYQRVIELDALQGPLSDEHLRELIDFLGERLRVRIKHVQFEPPSVSLEDVDRLNDAMLETYSQHRPTWDELLEEWLTRLARHHGKSRWGYKVPQDFMHADALAQAFPGVRFIFIIRNPLHMMRSLKYVHATDGHPWQYHPTVYARYWKMAVRTMQRLREAMPGQVELVKFEQLIADPQVESRRLAAFLDSELASAIEPRQPNTSFGNGKGGALTPSECRICERLAGVEMRNLGYELTGARMRAIDLPALSATTARFALYQARRLAASGNARAKVAAYLRQMRRTR